jgi:hypothetical protein
MEGGEPISTIRTQSIIVEYSLAAIPDLHILLGEEKYLRFAPGYFRQFNQGKSAEADKTR